MKGTIIPKIKKKVSSFISEEKGTISKQSMVSIGTFISTIAAASLASKEVDAGSIVFSEDNDGVNSKISGTHSHHSNHSNHSNHGNHGSHGSSDVKLKKNIELLEGSVQKIKQLNGVAFQWKENGIKDIGLIAQNVEMVFPELVISEKNIKKVNYAALVAPLIEGMKEQQIQIEKLQNEIDLLKKKNLLKKA